MINLNREKLIKIILYYRIMHHCFTDMQCVCMSLYAVSVNILVTALIWQLRYIMRLGVEMHVSYAALLNALPTASSSPTQ